jgi:hypothetical protein
VVGSEPQPNPAQPQELGSPTEAGKGGTQLPCSEILSDSDSLLSGFLQLLPLALAWSSRVTVST